MCSKKNSSKHKNIFFQFITSLWYFLIIGVFSITGHNSYAQVNIDSLLKFANAAISDTLIIQELSKTAVDLKVEKPGKAVELSMEAIELSDRVGYSKGLLFNHMLLGDVYYQLQEYENAIQNYELCIDYSLVENDSLATMKCYLNIGAIFYTQGLNNRALNYYLLALKYAKNRPKETIYNNIGLVYLNEAKYDDALTYFTKSLEIKQNTGNQLGIAISFNNIGEVYMTMKKFDIAAVYFEKSYAISNEIDDKEGMVFCLNNFGEIRKSNNELDSSIVFFNQALILSKQINNQFLTAQSLYNIGHAYFIKKDYSMARFYLLECYSISEALGILPEIEKSSAVLSEIYRRENNYELSHKYLNINKIATDSLIRSESEKQILKLKLDYQYKLKEEESKRLLELRQHEYKRAKFNLTTIIFVLTILLLLVVFLFIRIKLRHRINRVEKEKIELKKQSLEKELEFKNKEIIEKVLKIIERNELIENTVKRLREFSFSLPSNKRAEVNLINKELKSMEMKNQWTEFHHYFTIIYSKFFENLEKDYPGLTSNEKRLCAYLKLNMTTKDIATLTFQNFKSIEVARTRLRKRLDLTNKDIGFQEFFSKYN